jgi:hypothetical protein
MGMSRLTALIILSRGDDIHVTSAGPCDGKYIGWITLGEEDRYRPLLNTEPIYDTSEQAEAAMRKVVDDIRGAPDEFFFPKRTEDAD